MGRANNSFTSYVGHAEETISDDRVELPEKSLWVAVLCRACLDAFNRNRPRLIWNSKPIVHIVMFIRWTEDQARHFFMHGGFHFNLICEMAGRNPQYVQQKARKLILQENGWNVNVPITSHYRQGPKTGKKRGPKKNHLTGNAYYAAKAGREMKKRNIYYQGMGAKGGRPRIYNDTKD